MKSLVALAVVILAPSLFAAAPAASSSCVGLTDIPAMRNKETDGDATANGSIPNVFANKTDNGEPLAAGERTYDKGLYLIRGTQSWSYLLDGKYTGFFAELGQISPGGGQVVRILGDGKLLYESGILPLNSTVPALVDVRGVKELQFALTDTTAGIPWNTKAVIGNPRLSVAPLPGVNSTPGATATNKPPGAVIDADASVGTAPFQVGFRGDKSKDPDGQVMRYTWSFGDGLTETLAPNPKHTYAEPGLYEVVLQAEDDQGGVGIARQLITVRAPENQPPVATAAATARLVSVGETIRFDASPSLDPDGKIASFAWDFGDGKNAMEPVVEHAFDAPGRFPVTLTVTDDKGATTTRIVSMKVTAPGDTAKPLPLQKGARVLLLGNSLLGFNGPMDAWLIALDKANPEPLGLTSVIRGKGMAKLDELATWERLGIRETIDQGWDVVLIQPWIDATDPNVSDEDLLKSAATLVKWAREAGAFPVIYEPQFGWQNFDKDQPYGHERIKRLAEQLDTGFIPAGQGWANAEKVFPLVRNEAGQGVAGEDPLAYPKLLFSDFGHQNDTGSFFNALMVWKYLTGQSPLQVNMNQSTPHVTEKSWDSTLLERINWEQVPQLKKIADDTITPGSQKLR